MIALFVWETTHLPLSQSYVNPTFSLRAKQWVKGGVEGHIPRILYGYLKQQQQKNRQYLCSITPGLLAGGVGVAT